MLLTGVLQIDAINSNFDNFESALYMKSVSMPFRTTGPKLGTHLNVFFILTSNMAMKI